MKNYFFNPSIMSFSASVFGSLVLGIIGCVGIAYTNENGLSLASKSAIFGQLPEDEVRDLGNDLAKFKKLWKENRTEIMQRIREEVKDSEKQLMKESEKKDG